MLCHNVIRILTAQFRELDSISVNGQEILSHNVFRRLLLHENIHEQVSSLIDRISEALNTFLVSMLKSLFEL
jgi:hypothetical protein